MDKTMIIGFSAASAQRLGKCSDRLYTHCFTAIMARGSKRKLDTRKIAEGVRLILEGIGEDPNRDGLRRTPERVAEFYAELTEGMWVDPAEHIVPLPGDSHDEMVLVKDISIASVCEHHLAPFTGKCHIAYIPKNGRIIGLSKLARIAEVFARRLQVQERLTQEIAQTLFDSLKPVGVMVVIEAEHTCMTLRGVKKPGAVTITSAVLGGFRRDPRTRAEAMALIRG
jgi:GTP cyclohydrolase I